MYSLDKISVYIFNWKKVTDNSLKLYEKIKPIIRDTTIINCDESRAIRGSIQLDDSHYYGSQYDHAIKHTKKGNIFCVIVGDNICVDNFQDIFNAAIKTFNSYNVGVYAPNDKRSLHKSIIKNYDGTLFDVVNTDCGFWFIHPYIVSKLRDINYSSSKYGWEIDRQTIQYCKNNNFLVLRDYSVSTDQIDHICGYNPKDARLVSSQLVKDFSLIK